MLVKDFIKEVKSGGLDNLFKNIYKPIDIENQKIRYISAVEKFTALYRTVKRSMFIPHRVERK